MWKDSGVGGVVEWRSRRGRFRWEVKQVDDAYGSLSMSCQTCQLMHICRSSSTGQLEGTIRECLLVGSYRVVRVELFGRDVGLFPLRDIRYARHPLDPRWFIRFSEMQLRSQANVIIVNCDC